VSSLSTVEQGVVGELLFAVLAIVGSQGMLKAGFPAVDDEGRDVEIHLAGKFTAALAIQVKTATGLQRDGDRCSLYLNFLISPENMIDHRLYWYFLAHLDLERMRFSDYVFLLPSKLVHTHCRANSQRGKREFTFQGNMGPAAHDRWAPYRLEVTEVGNRLVQLMRHVPRDQRLDGTAQRNLPSLSGVCRLGLTGPATQLQIGPMASRTSA
jgi:hypothetical protein